jgi:hypothetical protein
MFIIQNAESEGKRNRPLALAAIATAISAGAVASADRADVSVVTLADGLVDRRSGQ